MTLLSTLPKQSKQFRSNGRQCLGVFYMLGVWFCLSQQKTESLYSSREKQPKKPSSCPLWNPSKIPGGNRHEIHYYWKNSQKSGTQCEIRTKTNSIKPSELLPKSRKNKTTDHIQNARLWRRSVCFFQPAYCLVDSWYVYRLTRNEWIE